MTGAEIAVAVVELVGGNLAKAAAGTWLSEHARGWLESRVEQDAFQQAIEKAYQDFGNEYSNLAASLFDKHFIENSLAQELSCFFSRTDKPSAARIAEAYRKQFSTSPDIEVAATRFVALPSYLGRRETRRSCPPRIQQLSRSHQREIWDSTSKYSGKVLLTHCGSLMRTVTPPSAASEKHIAMR